MNSSSHNKFSKSVSQFYLSKSSQQPLIKVDESGFMHRSSQFRLRKVNEMRQKLGARREKSLINYNRLSQILQTEERIFRSSSCFRNPYKFCLDESSKHLSTLLKSHILSREFYEAKKSKMVPKQLENSQQQQNYVSNYRYFIESQGKAQKDCGRSIKRSSRMSRNIIV